MPFAEVKLRCCEIHLGAAVLPSISSSLHSLYPLLSPELWLGFACCVSLDKGEQKFVEKVKCKICFFLLGVSVSSILSPLPQSAALSWVVTWFCLLCEFEPGWAKGFWESKSAKFDKDLIVLEVSVSSIIAPLPPSAVLSLRLKDHNNVIHSELPLPPNKERIGVDLEVDIEGKWKCKSQFFLLLYSCCTFLGFQKPHWWKS